MIPEDRLALAVGVVAGLLIMGLVWYGLAWPLP
jgi:hypothetical protein